jgi:hypothetical protein
MQALLAAVRAMTWAEGQAISIDEAISIALRPAEAVVR